MSRTDADETARPGSLPGPFPQVFAVVGGQAAWGIAVLSAYPVVQIACAAGQPLLVHLVRWIAAAVALGATATGYRVYRRAQQVTGEDEGWVGRERIQRVRFVGFGGTLLSGTGLFLLLVEDLATWVIDPCL